MKLETKFWAASVGHREMPNKYMACFAVPGLASQWVMDGARQRIFDTAWEAELAAWKALAAKLNRALGSQEIVVRPNQNREPRVYRKDSKGQLTEIDSVFRNFK